jgi:hypothetical protein
VNSRWMKTAATAWSCGMPALVSPAIMPASATPIPPGTGTVPPITETSVMTTSSVAMRARCPTTCSDAPRARATRTWPSAEPARTYTILRGPLAPRDQARERDRGRQHHADDDPDGRLVHARAARGMEGPRTEADGGGKQQALHDPAAGRGDVWSCPKVVCNVALLAASMCQPQSLSNVCSMTSVSAGWM